jgi:fructosamine-3-kinase
LFELAKTLAMWTAIAQQISEVTRKNFSIEERRSIGGGCINQGYALSDGQQTYFVKINQASALTMFTAEASGLKQISATKTMRIPQPICWGVGENFAYLVLEWLELGGSSNQAWERMGEELAAMHRVGIASAFGWEQNNTIGSTPQINDRTDNWADFFAERRIGYQLKLAQRRGASFADTNKIVAAIKSILSEHQPQPSIVHGDLWSGNAGILRTGEPTIFDPATYYGDREVDIAMTELFGGFPAAFYRGYNREWQLDEGYQHRKNIYNLYHILNHFNLFGGSYLAQAERMIGKITRA